MQPVAKLKELITCFVKSLSDVAKMFHKKFISILLSVYSCHQDTASCKDKRANYMFRDAAKMFHRKLFNILLSPRCSQLQQDELVTITSVKSDIIITFPNNMWR